MYLPVTGMEPTSSVFLGKCVTHKATVADTIKRPLEITHCKLDFFFDPPVKLRVFYSTSPLNTDFILQVQKYQLKLDVLTVYVGLS